MFPISDIESDNGIGSSVAELVMYVVREVCHMSKINEVHQKNPFFVTEECFFHPVGDEIGVFGYDSEDEDRKNIENMPK